MNKESKKRTITLTLAQIDFIGDLLADAERVVNNEFEQGPDDTLEQQLDFIEGINQALSVTL